MAIDVKRRAPDTPDDELELLWGLPARTPTRPARRVRSTRTLDQLVGFGWPAVIASIMLFHPPTNPAAQEWAYTGWATAGLFLALGLGVVAQRLGHITSALAASTVAGSVGLVLAYECRVAAQHYGNWWAYEFVAFGALTAASIAALALRARRARPT
jgi:hypothetical protein